MQHKLHFASLRRWGQDKMAVILQKTFSSAFFKQNLWISNEISLKDVLSGRIVNISVLEQIKAWCKAGDNLFSDTGMTHLTDT